MNRVMTISYQNRQSRGYGGSGVGSLSKDLKSSPKLVIANHFLKNISGFSISSQVNVEYLPNQIIITKLT